MASQSSSSISVRSARTGWTSTLTGFRSRKSAQSKGRWIVFSVHQGLQSRRATSSTRPNARLVRQRLGLASAKAQGVKGLLPNDRGKVVPSRDVGQESDEIHRNRFKIIAFYEVDHVSAVKNGVAARTVTM